MAPDEERASRGEPDEPTRKLADRIARLVRTLRFGSLEIIVHDSRVVLMTRTEKVRIDPPE